MTPEQEREHWQIVCRSYGEVRTAPGVYGDGEDDIINVEAWQITLRVPREPGATEPNYKALALAGQHAGWGLSRGVIVGEEKAKKEIRAALGIEGSKT